MTNTTTPTAMTGNQAMASLGSRLPTAAATPATPNVAMEKPSACFSENRLVIRFLMTTSTSRVLDLGSVFYCSVHLDEHRAVPKYESSSTQANNEH